jgi:hypothetical protein
MKTETPIDRVRRQLKRAIANMRADLERVELLSAALNAFNKPVPDYEPGFKHVRNLTLSAHQIG